MSDSIVLYRGDSASIRKFEFSRTEKHSLVGQGIYLTSKVEVAHSYRTKGVYDSSSYDNGEFFSGEFKNTEEAKIAAFEEFLKLKYIEQGMGKWPPKDMKKISAFRSSMIGLFEDMLLSKEIMHVKPMVGSLIKLHTFTRKANLPGRITKFVFPNDHKRFDNSVVNISKLHSDRALLDYLFECRLIIGVDYDAVEIRAKYFRTTPYPPNIHINYNRSIPKLKEIGYIGYEYPGGQMVGGLGRHRAFSIWDEEYVNAHKESTFK